MPSKSEYDHIALKIKGYIDGLKSSNDITKESLLELKSYIDHLIQLKEAGIDFEPIPKKDEDEVYLPF